MKKKKIREMDDEEQKIYQLFPYRESNPGRLGESQES